MVRLTCPKCGHSLDVSKLNLAGVMTCPRCGQSLRGGDLVTPEQQNTSPSDSPLGSDIPRRTFALAPPRTRWNSPTRLIQAGSFAAVLLLVLFAVGYFRPTDSSSELTPASSLTPADASPPAGNADLALIQKFKDSWRNEGWWRKSADEQSKYRALITHIVRTEVQNSADQDATLARIEQDISSW